MFFRKHLERGHIMNIKEKIKDYKIVIPLGILMGILVLALTGLFYGLFACKLIAGHEAMTKEIRSLMDVQSNIQKQVAIVVFLS